MPNRPAKFFLSVCHAVFLSRLALAQIPPEDLHRIEQALPAQATVKPQQPRQLLVFTRAEGYQHSSIPYAAKAVTLLGKQTGAFTTVESAEMAALAPENLRQFDAVLFASTTQLAFEDLALRQSLMAFVKSGKGVIGIHAATDNFYNWPEAADMMGGFFDGHPWHAGGTWAIKIVDPAHPLNAAFHGKDFQLSDEIYRIRPRRLRENSRVLVALDMTDKTNRSAVGGRFGDRDLPISWARGFGQGRVFYSSFGHNHAIYWNPAILQHFLDGIQFALGDLPVDTTPQPFAVESSFAPAELDSLFEKIATYEYGQSREPLVNLIEYFRLAAVSPKLQQQNEKRLLQLLAGNTTLAGKQFICEQLSIWGSKASVPVLAKMLQDAATADMARFALERIPDPAVDKVLRQALPATTGKIRIGIINSIGQRRDAQAVANLGELAEDSDSVTAAAALAALGRIGDAAATRVLIRVQEKTSGALKVLAGAAYLNCADRFLQQGQNDKALVIYQQLRAAQFSAPIRYAAWRGTIRACRENVSGLVLRLLKDSDTSAQMLGAQLVQEIPAKENVAEIAQTLPQLAPASQVQLLTALAQWQEAAVRQTAVAATQSAHPEVRAAALQALGKMGDASTVSLLAEIAARKDAEAALARKSLYRLTGAAVDETIVQSIAAAAPDVQVELILAANQRHFAAATPILLQTAQSAAAPVRLESIKALRAVADDARLSDLVELLLQAPGANERTELEKTITAVALQAPPEKRKSEVVMARLRALPAGTNVEARESLLKILGGIGDQAALPLLLAALSDTTAPVKTAAIVALTDWPTPEPGKNLLAIAENSRHALHQVLALRGFVRSLRFESEQPTADTIKKFQHAMELAANPHEQKMVLGWLAEVKSLLALELAVSYLKNEVLQPEAEVAAVKIAGAMSGSHPAEVKTLLQQVLQSARNDTLPHIKEARAMLEQIER